MTVTEVDFSVESVRQKFKRTVCGMFESQQECSVEFETQIEVKLKFSDVKTAQAVKESIEFSGTWCMLASGVHVSLRVVRTLFLLSRKEFKCILGGHLKIIVSWA